MKYAYLCPLCAHVETATTRRIAPYHKAPTFFGFRTHAMIEAGEYPHTLTLEQIKADVLAKDHASGVREIVVTSSELRRGEIRFQPARAKRWRRVMVK